MPNVTDIVARVPHFLTGATDGFKYQREHWVFQRAGLNTVYKPQRNMRIVGCDIDGSTSHEQCWGMRPYDVIDWEIDRCRFHDIMALLPDGDHYVGEHGFYGNVAGNLTIRRCSFSRIAGNGFQSVFIGRTKESSDYAGFLNAGGTIEIAACDFEDVGCVNPDHKPGGRASFPISCFPSSQDVLIHGCSISNMNGDWWNSAGDPTKPRFNSYGGIMANGHPTVRLSGNVVALRNNDRDVVQVRDVDQFYADGGEYVATKNNWKLDRVKHAEIAPGIAGGSILWRDGNVLGPVSKGWKW